MQRVKNVDYDEDDLYDEDNYPDEEEENQEYTAEDRENFANLTPVVRAELEESGAQATDTQIEEALWHYYWDVGKSVAYLKGSNQSSTTSSQTTSKKDKPKSKFDQAAQKNAAQAGESRSCVVPLSVEATGLDGVQVMPYDKVHGLSLRMSAADWFKDVPWTHVDPTMTGILVPAWPHLQRPKVLGGSSKLAKLAEERRKKAALQSNAGNANNTLSSLDRLSKPQDSNENDAPVPKVEMKRYPVRRKEASPPPKPPTPPPVAPKEILPDLRTGPTEFGLTLSYGSASPLALREMDLRELLGSGSRLELFNEPSPDDTVFRAQEKSKENLKAKSHANGLAKKTEALKLESAPIQPTQPKVRSKGLDVPKLWAEEKSKRKPSVAFVVIGHVDHGKSTLMGRLLLDTKAVSQRDIDKFKKQAAEIGKASFALAWVMDTGSDERERGVTVDIAQHHFSTEKVDFTILDAPGHRDFVPNMIGGTSMADFAVLVVDVNQLDSGMKGQTKEHILLARAVGLRRIIVAVNKLDSTNPPWSQTAFDAVSREITSFLTQEGFGEEDISIVPCSGLGGENVVQAPTAAPTKWISDDHSTLLQNLERSLPVPVEVARVEKPFRLQITDVFRGGITNPISVAGRIASGSIQVGDIIATQPSGETATVKAIEVGGNGIDWAVSGQICTLHLVDIDPQYLRSGDIFCTAKNLAANITSFTANVQTLESILPQGMDVHFGRLHAPGAVTQLVAILGQSNDVVRKKPRVVQAGQRATLKIGLESSTPLEVGNRVILRADGVTMAAGSVQAVDV